MVTLWFVAREERTCQQQANFASDPVALTSQQQLRQVVVAVHTPQHGRHWASACSAYVLHEQMCRFKQRQLIAYAGYLCVNDAENCTAQH